MLGWMTHKLESRLPGEIKQPQICRWYHFNGRKWRETKETLDEGERGEWKSWLKTQHSKNEDHGIQSHYFMTNRWGKKWKQWQILFSWALKSLWMVTAAMKLKDTCSLVEKLWQIEATYKKAETSFCDKGPFSQIYGFSSSHVWLWELDHNEGWVLKNWCSWIVVMDSWESLGQQRDQINQS